MHGISHLGPDDAMAAPPPTHGLRAALGAHPLTGRWRQEQGRAGSMESIIRTLEEERRNGPPPVTKPLRPPSKPPSNSSSLLDLSQPHIRLSPLQRASSHISLSHHERREETLLEQARRISVGEAVPALPARTSPPTRPSPSPHSGLSRHQSQASPGRSAPRVGIPR